MAGKLKLSREQLAKFLPSLQEIKAFEELFQSVVQETPEIVEEIYNLLSSQQPENLDPLIKRIEELELLVQCKDSLTDILNRLDQIETYLGI